MADRAAGIGDGKSVTVIGAGFSGLVSAYFLVKAGYRVRVVESRLRPGGLIETHHEPFGLVESAANGLLNSTLIEDLFSDIGVELVATLKESRKRFIFRSGRPRRWPIGPTASLRLLVFLFKYLFFRAGVKPKAEETVSDWSRRTMGQECADYLVSAFLQGIYAGDPEKMSATLIFGKLFASAKAGRSTKPSVRGTVSARGGMGEVIEKLTRTLEVRGVEFLYGTEAAALQAEPREPIVLAASATQAGQLLASLDPERAYVLQQIELLPIVTATTAISQTEPPQAFKGFGCLMPPKENTQALGVLMNGMIFPGRSLKGFAETWIFGGARAGSGEVLRKSDQELLDLIASERKRIFGVETQSLHGFRITRWPQALPHYTIQLEKGIGVLQGFRKNVILMGNYLGEIGLAKILERASRLPEEFSNQRS